MIQDPLPRKNWPIVLGIDPGTRVTGYGALVVTPDGPRLVECGVLRAPNNWDIAARLARIAGELEQVFTRVQPHHVAVETAFAARNVKSALRIGEARGMVLSVAGRNEANVLELAPAEAKKAVVGHGSASKEQIASLVTLHLGSPKLNVPLDATDALALGLALVRRLQHPASTRGVSTLRSRGLSASARPGLGRRSR